MPDDVGAMRALCVTVAKNKVIDEGKKAAKRKKDFVGRCDPDEYTPLEYGAEMRDPVDAGRQLEVLAQLFRDGQMPEHGVDILEGVASRCTHQEIGDDLGITDRAVEWRLGVMRRTFRSRMARLGIWPGMQPLHLIVSEPGAIAVLASKSPKRVADGNAGVARGRRSQVATYRREMIGSHWKGVLFGSASRTPTAR